MVSYVCPEAQSSIGHHCLVLRVGIQSLRDLWVRRNCNKPTYSNVTNTTMPYIILRESYISNRCIVDGLPLNEVRQISSSVRDERNCRIEFSTEAYNLLNALEQLGYKVVTSSSFVTGPKKFDTKDFVWTLYRPSRCDIEMWEMRLDESNSVIDINHNESKSNIVGRMPYITVKENAVKWWITVHGLNHHEVST